jgi:hypothetical protein
MVDGGAAGAALPSTDMPESAGRAVVADATALDVHGAFR